MAINSKRGNFWQSKKCRHFGKLVAGLMALDVANVTGGGIAESFRWVSRHTFCVVSKEHIPSLADQTVGLNLDRLAFHHMPLDTAITAKKVDKGTDLAALRSWVLQKDVETIAIGDGEADLVMFRAATRSFAPANIACRRQARFLGCQIAAHYDQQGLLEIVRKLLHADNHPCQRCKQGEVDQGYNEDLFLSVLRAADQSWAANLRAAIVDPMAYSVFIRP